ncbi:hypothetical protein EI555_009477, partial [Monodon monoceros]
MKNYLDAIYDVTVAFEGTVDDKGQRKEAPSMAEFLCKECPKIHIHIDRIDKKDVPEEQVYMKRWLHERFEIKDKLLIEFYDSLDPERRNKFPGESVNSKLSLKKTLPSFLILSGLTAGMLMTEAGRKLYVKTWIYGTLIGCLWSMKEIVVKYGEGHEERLRNAAAQPEGPGRQGGSRAGSLSSAAPAGGGRGVARGHPRSDGECSCAEPKARPFPRSRLGPRFALSDQRRGTPRGASLRGRTPSPWPEAVAPPPSPMDLPGRTEISLDEGLILP